MASAQNYPPVGFHFRVEFQGLPGASDRENLFREVSGLSAEIETETVKSGGENRFTYKLPKRASYPNLVLKRGLLADSAAIRWVRDAINTMEVEPIDIIVSLLNEAHEPLMSFQFVNAWPVKWSVSDFHAEESKLVVESLECYYQYFQTL